MPSFPVHTTKTFHRYRPYYHPPSSAATLPAEALVAPLPTTNVTVYTITHVAAAMPLWLDTSINGARTGSSGSSTDDLPRGERSVSKPPGSAGRERTGGFSLKKALLLPENEYVRVRVSVFCFCLLFWLVGH
jgi:hypothetical protein